MTINSGGSDSGSIYFGDDSDANVGGISYDHSDNSLNFKTNDATAMTISSAGNLTATGSVQADSFTTNGTNYFIYKDTSFTLTGQGFTTSPTTDCDLIQIGKVVNIQCRSIFGTSDSTGFKLTGFNSDYAPPTEVRSFYSSGLDNSAAATEISGAVSGSEIQFFKSRSASGWTASNTKGVDGFSLMYMLK